jgi:hypothetical protein
MLEEAGAYELEPAIRAGLISIHPLLDETTASEDALFDSFVQRLRELLVSPTGYPLFDDQVASLVSAAVNEGLRLRR